MAYDEALAGRFRAALAGVDGITERRMMGGACFFLDGNMIGGADRGASGNGRFMFRVGKDAEAEALRRPGASVVELAGRRMGGMVFVHEGACPDAKLKDWVALALAFVRTLPAK